MSAKTRVRVSQKQVMRDTRRLKEQNKMTITLLNIAV